MIAVITPKNIGRHLNAIAEMHRLRYRVFHARLGWEVETSGDMEVDNYDALSPVYLTHSAEDGVVDGCVRLLPTTGPYMLQNTFPILAGDSAIPSHHLIWEASRFAVDTTAENQRNRAGLTSATSKLIAGVAEYGLSIGLTRVVAVVDLRMERILRLAGWPLARMAAPRQIGVTKAVAGVLEVSRPVLDNIRRQSGLIGSVIENEEVRWAA